MPNPKGNPLTLQPYSPQWNSGPTKTVRIPIKLESQVLAAARRLDNGETLVSMFKAQRSPQLDEAIAILTKALILKPQAGGAIKNEIRKALALLNNNA